jgi:hypothetical protein
MLPTIGLVVDGKTKEFIKGWLLYKELQELTVLGVFGRI